MNMIECGFCDAQFTRARDHLMHLVKDHPDGGILRPRDVSCWRCARLIRPPAVTCECGFRHPLLEDHP